MSASQRILLTLAHADPICFRTYPVSSALAAASASAFRNTHPAPNRFQILITHLSYPPKSINFMKARLFLHSRPITAWCSVIARPTTLRPQSPYSQPFNLVHVHPFNNSPRSFIMGQSQDDAMSTLQTLSNILTPLCAIHPSQQCNPVMTAQYQLTNFTHRKIPP